MNTPATTGGKPNSSCSRMKSNMHAQAYTDGINATLHDHLTSKAVLSISNARIDQYREDVIGTSSVPFAEWWK